MLQRKIKMFVNSSKSNLPSLQIMRCESITALELRTRLLVSNFREGTIYVGLHFLLKNFTTRASLWGPLKIPHTGRGRVFTKKVTQGEVSAARKVVPFTANSPMPILYLTQFPSLIHEILTILQ